MQIKEFQSTPYYFHLAFRISGGRIWRSPLRVILRLPRGGPRVCDCSKLCLLAIFLVESELALILVVTLRRGCSARVAVLGLGRFKFAAASQSGRRGGARGDRDVRRRARRSRITRL